MSGHADILILGGGVIGLTTAYYLARDGARVTVLDKADFGRQASWAGAGIIPPGNSRKARTPFDLLRARSTEEFPRLSAQLREETGTDNGYRLCGGVELIYDGIEDAVRDWAAEEIPVQGLRDGPPGLEQLAPAVRQAGGYYLPGTAQVRNPRHLKALRAACAAQGVGLRGSCGVYGWVRKGDRVLAAETDQGQFAAGRFLLATGAWTDPLLQPLGWKPGIRPVRGQIALLNLTERCFGFILMQGKRYLVPRPDGRLLVGSTEEDAGFDDRPTASEVAGLLAFAADLVPGLASAPLERCWAGLRPGSPDGLPYLGLVPGCDNLFVAAGHFRSGIQTSPASGLAMRDLLLGREPFLPLEAFRPDRPAADPGEAAFRS